MFSTKNCAKDPNSAGTSSTAAAAMRRKAAVRLAPISISLRFANAEESPGADNQDRRHHHVRQRQLKDRKIEKAVRVQQPNHHRAQKSTPQAAQPAKHHHHEGLDDDQLSHPWRDRTHRDGERSSESR